MLFSTLSWKHFIENMFQLIGTCFLKLLTQGFLVCQVWISPFMFTNHHLRLDSLKTDSKNCVWQGIGGLLQELDLEGREEGGIREGRHWTAVWLPQRSQPVLRETKAWDALAGFSWILSLHQMVTDCMPPWEGVWPWGRQFPVAGHNSWWEVPLGPGNREQLIFLAACALKGAPLYPL